MDVQSVCFCYNIFWLQKAVENEGTIVGYLVRQLFCLWTARPVTKSAAHTEQECKHIVSNDFCGDVSCQYECSSEAFSTSFEAADSLKQHISARADLISPTHCGVNCVRSNFSTMRLEWVFISTPFSCKICVLSSLHHHHHVLQLTSTWVLLMMTVYRLTSHKHKTNTVQYLYHINYLNSSSHDQHWCRQSDHNYSMVLW